MKPDVWNKLLDLLHLALMSPCRTKADADRIDGEIDDLRREGETHEQSHAGQVPGGGSVDRGAEAQRRAGE